jgi:hypothetical protein
MLPGGSSISLNIANIPATQNSHSKTRSLCSRFSSFQTFPNYFKGTIPNSRAIQKLCKICVSLSITRVNSFLRMPRVAHLVTSEGCAADFCLSPLSFFTYPTGPLILMEVSDFLHTYTYTHTHTSFLELLKGAKITTENNGHLLLRAERLEVC